MSDFFTVSFIVNGEPASANFEFKGNAIEFAELITESDLTDAVRVVKRLNSGGKETIYKN